MRWWMWHIFWGLLVTLVAAITPIPRYPGAHVPIWLAWLATLAIGVAHEWGDGGRPGDLFDASRNPSWWPKLLPPWLSAAGVRDVALFLPIPTLAVLAALVRG